MVCWCISIKGLLTIIWNISFISYSDLKQYLSLSLLTDSMFVIWIFKKKICAIYLNITVQNICSRPIQPFSLYFILMQCFKKYSKDVSFSSDICLALFASPLKNAYFKIFRVSSLIFISYNVLNIWYFVFRSFGMVLHLQISIQRPVSRRVLCPLFCP